MILDERGESLDSATLASRLGRWRDDGRPAAVFIIGGDDGLAPSLRDKAERAARVRRRHLAAPARAHHAAGADLSRRQHPVRASLSSRLRLLSQDAAALLHSHDERFGTVTPIRLAHWPPSLGLALLLAPFRPTPNPRSMRCASATRSSRRSAPSRRRPPRPRPSSRTRSRPSARTGASSTRL